MVGRFFLSLRHFFKFGKNALHVLHGEISSRKSVDIIDRLYHNFMPEQSRGDLTPQRSAAAVIALAAVHDRHCLAAASLDRLSDLLLGEGPEHSEFEDTYLVAFFPEHVCCCLGSSCCGAHDHHQVIRVFRPVLLEEAVASSWRAP